MTSLKSLLALLLALSLGAAACGDDATEAADDTTTTVAEVVEDDTTDDTMAEGDADTDDTAADEADMTIVDIAVDNPDFSILVAALTEADLVGTLSGEGPFTVFAPTDAAFEQALTDLDITAEELLAREDLGDILTYHVVPGKVMSTDVVGLDGESVATVNGAEVMITVDGETVMVDDATVTTVDIEASNGVIHVIDAVLLP